MAGNNVSGQIGDFAAAVTTSDTADNSYSYLYIGGAGNVKITTESGQAITFNSLPAGGYLWIRTRLVWATGTTATNIVGIR